MQVGRWRDGVVAALTREHAFMVTSAAVFLAACTVTIWLEHSMTGHLAMAGRATMPMSEMSMAGMPTPAGTRGMAAGSFLAMWVVMMVAMMMPSLVPMLSRYRYAARTLGRERLASLTTLAGSGYFAVWTVLGAVVYAVGSVVTIAEPRWSIARSIPLVTGVALVIAGGVQLTRWKLRKLARCRDGPDCAPPLARGMGMSLQHGLRLGVHCMLCCSGFMVALLAGGLMDLRVMGLVATGITVERVTANPTGIARAAGVVLIAAGALVLGRAVG